LIESNEDEQFVTKSVRQHLSLTVFSITADTVGYLALTYYYYNYVYHRYYVCSCGI